MRRYLVLLVVALAAGVLLAIAGRLPGDPERGMPRPVPQPAARVALAIADGGIEPERASVPVGTLVTLTIESRSPRTLTVALSGYEDRLTIGALAPSGRWSGRFVADRPGNEFVWIVNGAPAGRFAVTGSHLVEGHE